MLSVHLVLRRVRGTDELRVAEACAELNGASWPGEIAVQTEVPRFDEARPSTTKGGMRSAATRCSHCGMRFLFPAVEDGDASPDEAAQRRLARWCTGCGKSRGSQGSAAVESVGTLTDAPLAEERVDDRTRPLAAPRQIAATPPPAPPSVDEQQTLLIAQLKAELASLRAELRSESERTAAANRELGRARHELTLATSRLQRADDDLSQQVLRAVEIERQREVDARRAFNAASLGITEAWTALVQRVERLATAA